MHGLDLPLPGIFMSAPPVLSRTNPIPRPSAAGDISRYMRRHRDEIEFLHVHNLRTAVSSLWLLLAHLLQKGHSFNVILTDHNARFFPFPRVTARWVDYFAPVSLHSQIQLQGWASRPSRVVPTAVSPPFVNQPEPPSFESRTIDLLHVGRIVPWKRPDRVVNLSLKLANLLGRPVRAVIAGSVQDPTYLEFIRNRVRLLGLERKVTIVTSPRDDELIQLYRSARLYTLLSARRDTFGRSAGNGELAPITILEAASAGTPAIVCAIPALLDQIQAERTGVFVDEFDDVAASRTVADILTDPIRWRKLSQGARNHVLRERTYPAIAKRFHDYLNDIRSGTA